MIKPIIKPIYSATLFVSKPMLHIAVHMYFLFGLSGLFSDTASFYPKKHVPDPEGPGFLLLEPSVKMTIVSNLANSALNLSSTVFFKSSRTVLLFYTPIDLSFLCVGRSREP